MVARLIVASCLVVVASDLAPWQAGPAAPGRDGAPLAVRITSPLGRTGLVERVRIVAQVVRPDGAVIEPVRFFVDDALLGEVPHPPYAVEWTDDNPFEPRDITVEVRDASGILARDRVRLEPLQVTERAQVAGVVIDAAVHDRDGRFVAGLTHRDFQLFENDVPQTLDLVRAQTQPVTYILLVDSSQSMARRIDFVKETATGLLGFLRPEDRVVV